MVDSFEKPYVDRHTCIAEQVNGKRGVADIIRYIGNCLALLRCLELLVRGYIVKQVCEEVVRSKHIDS